MPTCTLTEKKHRHKMILPVKGGQPMTMRVGANIPGSSPLAHPWFLPTHICRHKRAHSMWKKWSVYICLNPKLFKEIEWVYYNLCYSFLEWFLLDNRKGKTCILWPWTQQGDAVTETENRDRVQVLVERCSWFWTCLI